VVARLEAKQWLTKLQVHLLETQIASQDAYRGYQVEAESYDVEDLVKASIKQQASK
jgi:hypothetical protein